eukprot:GSMAST32.ASY1.ANO1.113.1 assembled CDS
MKNGSGIGDMEDMVNGLDLGPDRRAQRRKNSNNREVESKNNENVSELSNLESPVKSEKTSVIPGTQSIWVKTYGCSHNIRMLDSYGYRIVEDKSSADLWLINSCTVKDPSESAFVNLKSLPRLDLPKIRRDNLIEIIPLSTGCLGSYTIETIVNRARVAIDEGVGEIWLSSEDTGAYLKYVPKLHGRDIGTSLPSLLNALIELLPIGGNTMLRVGMTNVYEIADALNHPQVFSFLHVPVQSASDNVLRGMNREYTRDEFCRVVDFLRRRVPGTPAARMKRVRTQLVKARSRELYVSL